MDNCELVDVNGVNDRTGYDAQKKLWLISDLEEYSLQMGCHNNVKLRR